MTSMYLLRLFDLLTEPTVGLPILLTLGLAAAWLLWSPRPLERPPAVRRTWYPPTTDPVSLVYYALADGRYSTVLGTVYERLDEAVEGRYHIVIGQLPVLSTEDAPIPGAQGLRRAARQIRRAYSEALQRESPYWFRWTFWRPEEIDRDRFLGRVDDAIRVSAEWISTLEATP